MNRTEKVILVGLVAGAWAVGRLFENHMALRRRVGYLEDRVTRTTVALIAEDRAQAEELVKAGVFQRTDDADGLPPRYQAKRPVDVVDEPTETERDVARDAAKRFT